MRECHGVCALSYSCSPAEASSRSEVQLRELEIIAAELAREHVLVALVQTQPPVRVDAQEPPLVVLGQHARVAAQHLRRRRRPQRRDAVLHAPVVVRLEERVRRPRVAAPRAPAGSRASESGSRASLRAGGAREAAEHVLELPVVPLGDAVDLLEVGHGRAGVLQHARLQVDEVVLLLLRALGRHGVGREPPAAPAAAPANSPAFPTKHRAACRFQGCPGGIHPNLWQMIFPSCRVDVELVDEPSKASCLEYARTSPPSERPRNTRAAFPRRPTRARSTRASPPRPRRPGPGEKRPKEAYTLREKAVLYRRTGPPPPPRTTRRASPSRRPRPPARP